MHFLLHRRRSGTLVFDSKVNLQEKINMADSFSMQDKSIVITGASRGIGRGLARYFAEQGAKVAAIARNMDQLHELQD